MLEALSFASTNPQYDDRLFIELQFNTWKFQAQTWGEHIAYRNCFWHSEQFLYTTCSPHVLQKEELLTKIYLYLYFYYAITLSMALPLMEFQVGDTKSNRLLPKSEVFQRILAYILKWNTSLQNFGQYLQNKLSRDKSTVKYFWIRC